MAICSYVWNIFLNYLCLVQKVFRYNNNDNDILKWKSTISLKAFLFTFLFSFTDSLIELVLVMLIYFQLENYSTFKTAIYFAVTQLPVHICFALFPASVELNLTHSQTRQATKVDSRLCLQLASGVNMESEGARRGGVQWKLRTITMSAGK